MGGGHPGLAAIAARSEVSPINRRIVLTVRTFCRSRTLEHARPDRGGQRACARQFAPDWQGVLHQDESALEIVARSAPPWNDDRSLPSTWTDTDDVAAAAWMQRQVIAVGKDIVSQAVWRVARDRRFHPIRDYLDSLVWDEEIRLEEFANVYFGAEPSEYVDAVGLGFFLGAVARIYEPGAKVDTCIILEGPQGSLRSSALRALGEPWFTDELADLGSKDAAMQMRGKWIIELAELDAMQKTEVARIKSFMSRSVDRYRPPYGRRVITVPRECVFAGTVNHSVYLKDETGGDAFGLSKRGKLTSPPLSATATSSGRKRECDIKLVQRGGWTARS